MKREPGLDLLRCVALLCVITFHGFLYNGYYREHQAGAAMLLAGSVRWLSVSCVGLFLMLTGYLKSGRTELRACYRGLPSVLLGYLLAAAVSIPVRHFFLGDPQPLFIWVRRLLGFRGVYYGWYVEMYVGLMLLSPFVNRGLMAQPSWGGLLALGAVLLAVTALPGATPLELAPAYWRSMYPLTYYVLGALVRRFQPEIPPWAGLAGALLTALGLGAATVLSTGGDLSGAFTQEFGDLWIVVMVVCLFVGLYRVRPGGRLGRLLSWGAGGCFGGYLLSHLLDAWCYRLIPGWRTPGRYPLLFLTVTVPIFLCSILGGKLLELGCKQLLKLGRRRAPCLR